jgi:hypothetical protein
MSGEPEIDWENLTVEEIDAELLELGRAKDRVREQMREGTAVRDKKVARESLGRKLEGLSPAERAELGVPEPQTISPPGLPPRSAVGRPAGPTRER